MNEQAPPEELQRARTRSILETAVDGIITIDERGIVDSFNPAAVVCGSGYRGVIAASFLKREGYENVANVVGGMTGWKAAGLPVVQDQRGITA